MELLNVDKSCIEYLPILISVDNRLKIQSRGMNYDSVISQPLQVSQLALSSVIILYLIYH